jgi:hypothetical protein
MRALSGAAVVLAGAACIAAEVQTAHLHPDRWGLVFGIPLVALGLVGWLATLLRRDPGERPPPG